MKFPYMGFTKHNGYILIIDHVIIGKTEYAESIPLDEDKDMSVYIRASGPHIRYIVLSSISNINIMERIN